jgi:heme oxygenase (mycobilin-producing)
MPAATFLALSRFKVGNVRQGDVLEAFLRRPHLVDEAEGFVRMDVVSPTADDAEFWLLTWWQDEESFWRWHHSHLYRDSHAGIPKRLNLVPSDVSLLHRLIVPLGRMPQRCWERRTSCLPPITTGIGGRRGV